VAVVINVYGKANLSQIEKAEKQLAGMKREVAASSGPWSRLGGVISSTGAQIASGLAAARMTRRLMGSLPAARESQANTAKLAASVQAAGGSWDSYSASMKKVVAEQSAISAYSGGQLKQALTALIQTTGSTGKSFDLLGVTQDLARAKGLDLAKAGTLIGKVAMGNTSALSRYGIVLNDGATAQEALAAIQNRFKGAAKAYGDTSAGAADKFKNSLKSLQVTVGTAILPSLTFLMGKLSAVLGAFQRLPGPVQNVVVGVAAIAAAGLLLAPFISSIVTVTKAVKLAAMASKIWAAAQWLLNVAMSANPVAIVIVAIVALVAAIVIAYKKSDTIRKIVTVAWNGIKRAAVSVFGWLVSYIKTWVTLVRKALAGISAVVNWITGRFSGMRQAIVASFFAIVSFAASIAGRIRSAIGNVGSILYSVGQSIVRGLLNGIVSAWHWVTDKLHDLVGGLSKAAKKVLGIHSPSRVFAEIGKNIGAGLAGGIEGMRSTVASASIRLADAARGGASSRSREFVRSRSSSGSGRSIVIQRGAVQVSVTVGAGAGAGEVRTAVESGAGSALERLARELRAL
jgi:phage-related protein